MRFLTWIDGAVRRLELALAVAAMLGVVTILSAQVFFRYVLLDPIFFAEEVALLLLIIATFAGLSLLVAEECLIGIDLVGPKLSPAARARLDLGMKLLTALISGALAVFAVSYVITPWVWFERFATVPLPRASLYTLVAIELCLATFHQVVLILKGVFDPTSQAAQ
ncbi:MAG: TRAP transporter small permease subunit [Pseudomonadota bacterium]